MVIQELKIVSERENKVVGRKELVVEISHTGKGTPKRSEIREKVSEMLKVPGNLVVVRKILTEYGMTLSQALIHVYPSEERLKSIEPRHIVKKNFEESKEGE